MRNTKNAGLYEESSTGMASGAFANANRRISIQMESESETDMDLVAQVKAQKEQLLKHKNKGADAGKKGNKLKRVITGIAFLGYCLAPIYLGPTYVLLNTAIIVCYIFGELTDIGRDIAKDQVNSLSGPGIEWTMFIIGMFAITPRINLKQNIMENSYITEAEFPTLHAVLYTYRDPITMIAFLSVLLWFVCSLQRGAMSYQFKCFGFSMLRTLFLSYSTNCYAALIFYGKAWSLYVPIIVTANDVAAYVCGMTFGKTPLIKLSPNKTMEGFVGGALLTLVCTFFFVENLW